MVSPSGEKRALLTPPRWKVTRWNVGAGGTTGAGAGADDGVAASTAASVREARPTTKAASASAAATETSTIQERPVLFGTSTLVNAPVSGVAPDTVPRPNARSRADW